MTATKFGRNLVRLPDHVLLQFLLMAPQALLQARVRQSQDLGGKDGGVLGSGTADGHGGHGDARGHLHRGQQAVQALEMGG